ncbi:retrovirus-related pol polyprotein from transposon TNT 1-94 [Tanacetum coccineum]
MGLSKIQRVKFLRSKDETPEFVINFLKQIQLGLNKTVRFIRTDNGTEFVNQVMSEYYEGVGIFHQKSVPRTPQQNVLLKDVICTLVEATRTMMDISRKLQCEIHRIISSQADIGIFVGYALAGRAIDYTTRELRRLMETIHVTFDEMHQSMAPVHTSLGPAPFIMTPGQLKSGLAPTIRAGGVISTMYIFVYNDLLKIHRQQVLYRQHRYSSSKSITSRNCREPFTKDTPIIHDVRHPSHNLFTGDPVRHKSSSGKC